MPWNPLLAMVLASVLPAQAPAPALFPAAIEVVPGELTVHVFHHMAPAREGALPCWTYVSRGLAAHGQSEIALTVRQRPGEADADYPRESLKYFAHVLAFAKRGQTVQEGGFTDFSPQAGFLGRKELSTLVYVKAGRLADVESTPDTLWALGLIGDEGKIARQFGVWRVLGRLAAESRFYPTPIWTDRDRAPLLSMSDVAGSLLAMMPRVHVPASGVVREREMVTLRMRPPARAQMVEAMGRLQQDYFVLLTGLDPAANAMYVWRPQATAPEAVKPDGSDASRLAGTFIAFVGGSNVPAMRLMESGFSFILASEDWRQVKDALLNARPLRLPKAGGEVGLAIEWVPETYTSADGRAWRAPEGFVKYEPSGGRREDEVHVALEHVVLLSSEADMQAAGVGVDALGNYIGELRQAAARHLAGRKAQGELAVSVTLQPAGPELAVGPKGKLALAALSGLREALAAVKAPRPLRTIRFELVFQLRRP